MASHLLQILAVFGIISLVLLSQQATADDEEVEEDFGETDIESMSVNGQTIQFGIPEDDDDFHSMHIPAEFKCEACKILAKQFTTAFDKANEKRPSLNKKLPESDVIDLLEEECENDFMQVGVKEVDGVKRLSGPGMSIQEEVGIMQGGGKWPYRMKALCLDIVGEVEEDEIYNLYKDGQLETHLCLTKYDNSNCITTTKNGMKRIEL